MSGGRRSYRELARLLTSPLMPSQSWSRRSSWRVNWRTAPMTIEYTIPNRPAPITTALKIVSSRMISKLTGDAALKTLYGQDRFRGNQPTGSDNFEIIRDDTIFNAVVIGAGRFGIVYSIVIGAVRQFTLHEERRLHDWEVIKGDVNNLASSLYDR